MKEITQLTRYVSQGSASIYKAGQLIQVLQAQGLTLAKISRLSETLTVRNLKDLLAISENRMLPELLVFKSPAVNYLKKFPIEKQREIMLNGVERVKKNERGFYEKDYLPVARMSHADCKTVFNNGRIRSERAQKDYIRTKPAGKPSYKYENGKLVVLRPTSFSNAKLVELMSR